jgi:HlyD family secretion protein
VIEVPNAGERLVPGATAVVTMVGSERRDVLRVPNQALVFQPPPEIVSPTARPVSPGGLDRPSPASVRARVWKYVNGHFVPIEIETGLAEDHWTEVLRGDLRAGDQVVTSASIRR